MIDANGEKLALCHDCVIRGVDVYKPLSELKSRRRANNQIIFYCKTHWASRKGRLST